MPFIVLPGGGAVIIIGQKTLREKLGIDVMAQLKASVLKAQGRQDGAGMELTARSVGEPNDGAVLRAAMSVTVFVPGGDAPGDVDDEVTLTLSSQRPMIFQDSEVEMRDRVGVLETAVDNAVDHGSPPESAKMLRDIAFCAHFDVFCRALSGDSPARKKPGAVRFHLGARVKIYEASEFPLRGEKWTDIMADVESFVMPGITHWQHPRFFAYFPANSSPPAILGDMLASMFNVIGFSWEASPASTELEVIVLDQLARAVGLPDVFLSDGEGGGVIQGSASEGTLVGLLAARTRALKFMRRMSPGVSDHELMAKMTIYTSDQAHSSVQKAANIAGLGTNVRMIATRGGGETAEGNAYALDVVDLATAMREDIAAGLTPVFVNANVGSTNSCAVDPVLAMGDICQSFSGKLRAESTQSREEEEEQEEDGLVPWLHVDAAYAGSAAMCPENRWVLDGVEAADSVLFNLHKCDYLVDALSVTPEILQSKEYRRGQVSDFRDWQLNADVYAMSKAHLPMSGEDMADGCEANASVTMRRARSWSIMLSVVSLVVQTHDVDRLRSMY
eukprot:jgi/Undpi1/5800/HiC_scaffold_2.g01074.m1